MDQQEIVSEILAENELFAECFFSSDSSDGDIELLNKCSYSVVKHVRTTIRHYCTEIVPSYTEVEFFSHFRISKAVCYALIDKFTVSEIYQKILSAGNSNISAEKHFLAFLWFCGHETVSFRDVADRFDLSISSLHDIITRVSLWLSNMACDVIKWPSKEEKKHTKEYYKRISGFPSVIGAIDGTHIKIDRPKERETDYCNRNDYFSIILQGRCNEKKFIDIFIGYPGSVHDARVFQNSPLYNFLYSDDEGNYLDYLTIAIH
ncbi:putative nuclease HARBI1 isoform X2 [Onthophagus taurus]|uniref:putative nuclease HARBI1 isoform X2 n=1 Tax=Onthophagus taurus TaxID=166361 RepID=UPI0039BEAE3A